MMTTVTPSMCGCYYVPSVEAPRTKNYLPQVDLQAHTTVVSTSSRTMLSQTFINASAVDVKECTYVFPLYDGVSVVGFTCRVGSRVIKGIVKEKVAAKQEYDAAVGRGETAGLFEQGATSDVFTTSLGNIPAGEKLLVTITYIGALKYDVGADGIRFTVPTMISPRYGQDPMRESELEVSKGGIAITVDIKMPQDSPLREVRSPSHPISVTLGRTSASESQPPHLSRASAALSLGTSALDKDFVLEIMLQNSGTSQALLETHPTILGQRALMATFLHSPVQQSKPEVIFVADQSGSMRGARTRTLVAALRVFLKSLPVGIKFNVCYFGDSHSFLFPESQTYDQNSLAKALKSLNQLNGSYGGTETLGAVKASIESRNCEQPLSLILATDGDIWQQQELFDYLNDSETASKKALRVFALGIGNSVSSALVEGVARAGNGFAQSVGQEEKFDGKVIRMLRGALIPDFGALTLEVQYQKDDEEGDEFVMVESVTDSLRVLAFDEDSWTDAELDEDSAVSAETRASEKQAVEPPDVDGEIRDSGLPEVPAPKLMQIPQIIPPLYPYSRTSVFLLISPDAAHGTIKSIVLKSTSAEEPFELGVPVEVLSESGETIHQLAARKAITELEEGRGWLTHAKDENEVSIKAKYSSRFESMVEREAVRLGIQYQIAGKFTSFVATETAPEALGNTVQRKVDIIGVADPNPPGSHHLYFPPAPPGAPFRDASLSALSSRGLLSNSALKTTAGNASFGSSSVSGQGFSAPTSHGLFGNSMSSTPAGQALYCASATSDTRFSTPTSHGLFGNSMSSTPTGNALMRKKKQRFFSELSSSRPVHNNNTDTEADETDPFQEMVALQAFEGYWNLDARFLEIVGLEPQHKAPQEIDSKVWASMLAITFLEERMASEKESWVMIVEKARGWLKGMEKGRDGSLEEKWKLAKLLIMRAD